MIIRDRERLAAARVGRLATVRPDGRPHLVVLTFAVLDDTIVSAVDSKPKRTQDLQRLRNIAATPAVSLLVDHYEEDWSRLWWTRLDGTAEVVADEPRRETFAQALADKYDQYRLDPPGGPVIVLTVQAQTSWTSA